MDFTYLDISQVNLLYFYVMAEWIAEVLFMLFYAYTAV